jgi:hypothetical protein
MLGIRTVYADPNSPPPSPVQDRETLKQIQAAHEAVLAPRRKLFDFNDKTYVGRASRGLYFGPTLQPFTYLFPVDEETKKTLASMEITLFRENKREITLNLFHEKVGALPEIDRALRFSVGENVKLPKAADNPELAEWTIIRAEKGHYLLERWEPGSLVHAFGSEDEILKHNER